MPKGPFGVPRPFASHSPVIVIVFNGSPKPKRGRGSHPFDEQIANEIRDIVNIEDTATRDPRNTREEPQGIVVEIAVSDDSVTKSQLDRVASRASSIERAGVIYGAIRVE